jgi:tetratricopeptide (TPR) repeat protein
MRKCAIFVSIPGEKFFEEMYYQAIKPITEGNLDIFSFFDRPPYGDFAKEINLHIAYSNIVVAVASGSNPNVLYELGLAVGNGKPILPITDDPSHLPAMIRHIGAVIYDRQGPDWPKLTGDLAAACRKILISEYMELRRRSHMELLLGAGVPSKSASGSVKKLAARDKLGKAIAAYQSEDYEQVIRVLAPLVEQGIGDAATYFFLSDAYFLRGESMPEGEKKHTYYRRQLDVALQGHDRFGEHQDIHKNLGLAYLKLRELNKAQSTFEELARKHPDYRVARYNLACVHAQRGELFPCMSELTSIIEKEPSWRILARVDPDFDPFWQNDLFQRLLFPVAQLK